MPTMLGTLQHIITNPKIRPDHANLQTKTSHSARIHANKEKLKIKENIETIPK